MFKIITHFVVLVGFVLGTGGQAHAQEALGKIGGNSTPVRLRIGNQVIPATLNDTTTAKDLIGQLPYQVRLKKYAHDYCGTPPARLHYDEKDVQFGWRNGEISYEKQTPYFVIFFGDEEHSKIHGNQVIIGKIDGDLDTLKSLDSTIDITIERAQHI